MSTRALSVALAVAATSPGCESGISSGPNLEGGAIETSDETSNDEGSQHADPSQGIPSDDDEDSIPTPSGDGTASSGNASDEDECDLWWGSTECSEGLKCTPRSTDPDGAWGWAGTCVPIIGVQEVGDSCHRDATFETDDCAAGLWCNPGTPTGSGLGFCDPLCDPRRPDSCHEDWGLHPSYQCLTPAEHALSRCIVVCDPVSQDCASDEGCYHLADDTFICLPSPEDDGGHDGDACLVANDCRPGLDCVQRDELLGCMESACCTSHCDLDAEEPNDVCNVEGSACMPWYEAPVGVVKEGFCGRPND